MKVLHLAAGNRWTGAAAPAFAEVEALRAAGVDAHYAYVGGYKLEQKLRHTDFAHPLIEKAQNPLSFRRTVEAIRTLVRRHGFDVLHAHLTYDHWLARFATEGPQILARTFHARRVLRSDPFTRSLIRRTPLLFVINADFDLALLSGRAALFTPPPLDHRQFSPEGDDARSLHQIGPDEIIVTVIGKLSAGRGFEDALHTFARMRKERAMRMMIIGHGEHRPVLEKISHDLGITDQVIWAGYHETDLAEHYRASNLLLFTARGSDEGHRAVLEAMACGVPPVSFPIPGIPALLGTIPELISSESSPDSLASTALRALTGNHQRSVAERSLEFGYDRAANRLIAAYDAAAGVD